jgi:hypothetical protein
MNSRVLWNQSVDNRLHKSSTYHPFLHKLTIVLYRVFIEKFLCMKGQGIPSLCGTRKLII